MAINEYSEPSKMEGLTKKLAGEVQTLEKLLRLSGHQVPSFNRDTPPTVVPNDAPESAHLAREKVMDYALQIFQLAAGPSDYLANLQTGYHYIACLQWLCSFKVFDFVPLKGEVSYAQLALDAQVSESRLKSVARMAMTSGLFAESTPEHIAHSPTSALLRTSENFNDWAVFMCDISAPTAAAMVEAHKKWPDDVEKTHTAYNIAFDTDVSFFQHLKQLPERQKQFAGYMKSAASNRGTHLRHMVNGYDWAKLGKAVVVDVGGSVGHGSIALAQEFPQLSFIVQDLPSVVSGAEQQLASFADGDLPGRIKFQGHSFFESQPVVGADVYLLRMILHDWAFEDSVKILRNLRPALTSRSRILIMDTVLPNPGSIPASKERLLRVRDLTMMQVFNSLERGIEDWRVIFAEVDPGLVVESVSTPPGSNLSLIELSLGNE
ncbi:putative O-methyltransferase [Fusarium tricinctum]|uniref:O-methyltransferase n=1 Tax=Fusarium tricinctum TaxID=61284 RepID=A0A8K0S619_9HYPO|nr:putative O-methyltransferase [Fusarium tricinctum]